MILRKSVLKIGSEIVVSIMVVFSELTVQRWQLMETCELLSGCVTLVVRLVTMTFLTGGLLLSKVCWACNTCCQISNKEHLTEGQKLILLFSAHLVLLKAFGNHRHCKWIISSCHATGTGSKLLLSIEIILSIDTCELVGVSHLLSDYKQDYLFVYLVHFTNEMIKTD